MSTRQQRQQQQQEPSAGALDAAANSTTASADDNNNNYRRNKSIPIQKLAIFLLFLSPLFFIVGTMNCSLSKSKMEKAAFPDYPTEAYRQNPTGKTKRTAAAAAAAATTTKLLPTAATHPRGPTPYNCGVVFFFHIPCTGGRSIAKWLSASQNGNITFYQKWATAIGKDGQFKPHQDQDEIQTAFIDGMNAHIQNLGQNEWRSGQLHILNPPLNSTEHLWQEWRATVEKQGCQMINTIMLRDPLNHAINSYEILQQNNLTNGPRKEWMDHLNQASGTGKWATVLDFFLYNIIGPDGRNPYNATKEEKVRRGVELLQRHFDVVSLGDHTQFMNEVINYTGWKTLDMPHMNVHKSSRFSKKEVETLYKLLVRNGDVDFVDAVKQRYSGHLSYLSDI